MVFVLRLSCHPIMDSSPDQTPLTSPADAARLARDMPWKARNEIARWLLLPLARVQFALAGVAWGSGWALYGLPIIQKHRRSTLTIGARLALRSSARSNPLGPAHPVILSTRRAGAVLTIGDDFGMTGGAVVAEQRITIGHRVTVGANAVITDTDFHPLDAQTRRLRPADGATAPVSIGDDVFIGMHALVLKGVTVGAGSVIGAGSVVTRDIPPGVIAAGNPARVIRAL